MQKKFLRNLFFSLVIMALLMFFDELPWVMKIENTGMDLVMELNQGIIPPLSEKNIPAFVLVDINDETYHAWGEPLFTPRNHLTNLIKVAVEKKAAMVIVGIDVSQPTPVVGSQLHPDDLALKNYLKNYVTECNNTKSKCPPIILVRAFQTVPNLIPVPRTGFLEELVAQSAPLLQWSSAGFLQSDDAVVRRWELWQPTCTSDKQPQVIPSIELLVMAEVKGCTDELQQKLNRFLPQNCDTEYQPPSDSVKELCGLPSISTNVRNIDQRILYTMPWSADKQQPWGLQTESPEPEMALMVCSALNVIGSEPNKDCLAQLENSMVVIGGSYRDGSALHSTPLGDMPGSLVITNAIHSILQYGTIQLPPTWVNLLIYILLIIVISFLFALGLNTFLGLVLSILFVIVPALALSYYSLIHYNIWFDFARLLVGLELYHIFFGCEGK